MLTYPWQLFRYNIILTVTVTMSESSVHCSVEQRIIIKFLTNEGVNSTEILTRLRAQYGDQCLSKSRVFEWSKSFRDGRTHVANEPHVRRAATSVNRENEEKVNALIQEDRRVTVRQISQNLQISVGSVEEIIKNKLEYRKVSARWIPRLLTEEHKLNRLQITSSLLQRYEREADEFLDSIVITDETWVHYFTPESKRASMQWRHTTSPKPKKAKTVSSADKVMATFFWDSQGVLFVDFLTERRTINADYYLTLLRDKVKQAIRNKRKRRQSSVCLLQDNARPHTAAKTIETINKLQWDLLPHPAYSPDLAPSDFYLFRPLKEFLAGKRFQSNNDVIEAVQEWIRMQPKDFFQQGIKKLPDRWRKCIARQGDYVEK